MDDSIKMLIYAGWVVISALITLVWQQLNSRINRVETSTVDRTFCTMREQLLDERIKNLQLRLTEMSNINKEDHITLKDSLISIDEKLQSIRECVNKLSAGINCE